MKKFLLGTVGLLALGMAAPATATDLGCPSVHQVSPSDDCPYPRLDRFYIGANGGWGQSRNCWGIVPVAGALSRACGCPGCRRGDARYGPKGRARPEAIR